MVISLDALRLFIFMGASMFICGICNRKIKTIQGLGIHLRKSHNMNRQEHYLKYEKHKFCTQCNKILTVYQNIFCSQKCSALNHIELAKESCRGGKHWLKNLDNETYRKSNERRKKKISDYNKRLVKENEHPFMCHTKSRKRINKKINKGLKQGKYKRNSKEFAKQASIREKKKAEKGIHSFQTKSSQIRIKREKTLLKRYGANNPGKIPEFVLKRSGENHPHWRGGISYKTYGKDWNVIRLFILVRDNYRCIICNTNKQVEVHHIVPISSRIDIHELNNPFNLISLCKSCHQKQEWTNCYEKEIVKYLNNWGKFISRGGEL